MKPLCPVCGDRHYSHQAHVFASNKAPKPASNRPKVASNAASNKHQRWDKKAYNAYMRMYMKVLRAVKGGKADWWPKRA